MKTIPHFSVLYTANNVYNVSIFAVSRTRKFYRAYIKFPKAYFPSRALKPERKKKKKIKEGTTLFDRK